jgi:hypothetical protein
MNEFQSNRKGEAVTVKTQVASAFSLAMQNGGMGTVWSWQLGKGRSFTVLPHSQKKC